MRRARLRPRFSFYALFILSVIIYPITAATAPAVPTSPYSPLHAIAIQKPRIPEQPICCLVPLPPSPDAPPAEELEILSFEEWKARQAELQAAGPHDSVKASSAASSVSAAGNVQEIPAESVPDALSGGQPVVPAPEFQSNSPPHFRVPLVDRFNYASDDCSARVHTSHKSARSPSAILSAKKDRYMLAPCDTPDGKNNFVVIELCEDIRIDTVQLANFEFFSGVFKEFSVSVARTYSTESAEWTFAGRYTAKNIRGIQSFHPPTSLNDFYRYLRIDFHSHYSTEFYCPISLLRVFGLTHLEQFKWDEWEAEYKAKSKLSDAAIVVDTDHSVDKADNGPRAHEEVTMAKETNTIAMGGSDELKISETSKSASVEATITPESTEDATPMPTKSAQVESSEVEIIPENSIYSRDHGITTVQDDAPEMISLSSTLSSDTGSTQPSTEKPMVSVILASSSTTDFDPAAAVSSENYTVLLQSESQPLATSPPDPSRPIESPTTSAISQQSQPVVVSETSNSTSTISSTSSPIATSHPPQSSSSVATTVVPHSVVSIPPVGTTGESIYKTIMTRLGALEMNATLYLRYVEEQGRSMRDAMRRLEEEVGRLEGIGKSHAALLSRTTHDWETQRKRLEREHGELLVRVGQLAEQVTLEQRLGIAQLCLLLTVLVCMALTRGGGFVMDPYLIEGKGTKRAALREWGRRHLSSFSSGEWAAKFSGRATSTTPKPTESKGTTSGQVKVEFPGSRIDGDRTPKREVGALTPVVPLSIISSSKSKPLSVIRAPQLRSHRPVTPTSTSFSIRSPHSPSWSSSFSPHVASSSLGRPRLRRSSSHTNSPALTTATSMSPSLGGNIYHSPLSVKKWARSAHLHEIRRSHRTGPSQTLSVPLERNVIEPLDSQDRSERNMSPLKDGNQGRTLYSPTGTNEAKDRDNFWLSTPPDSRSNLKRDPLLVSPLQNQNWSSEDASTSHPVSRVGLGLGRGSYMTGEKLLDIDTESENWIDTDVEDGVSDEGDEFALG